MTRLTRLKCKNCGEKIHYSSATGWEIHDQWDTYHCIIDGRLASTIAEPDTDAVLDQMEQEAGGVPWNDAAK